MRQGGLRDAILHSAGANADHGLRRTNDDKRRAVLMLLQDEVWGQWNDSKIARACAVSQPFVTKVRSEHLQTFEDSPRLVERGGTVYPMKPRASSPSPADPVLSTSAVLADALARQFRHEAEQLQGERLGRRTPNWIPLSAGSHRGRQQAEATALLIRCGYRVYRPEADIEGEDLVVRDPAGVLTGVQLKGRPLVDWRRYGGRQLLMLFPSAPYAPGAARMWFLVPHDLFFDWVKALHGHTPKWGDLWHYPSIGRDLAAFLAPYEVRPPAEQQDELS